MVAPVALPTAKEQRGSRPNRSPAASAAARPAPARDGRWQNGPDLSDHSVDDDPPPVFLLGHLVVVVRDVHHPGDRDAGGRPDQVRPHSGATAATTGSEISREEAAEPPEAAAGHGRLMSIGGIK